MLKLLIKNCSHTGVFINPEVDQEVGRYHQIHEFNRVDVEKQKFILDPLEIREAELQL